MPFRSEEQRKWMWANKPKMARKWTDEHGSTPVKAKAGKYQELKHPQHDVLPLEHMEEKVSSKERVERLLDDRKKKKESKKKLVKEGQGFVPGWRPNLSVKAAEGELIREKTRGTGAAVKGTDHYVMKGMDAAQEGKLIQVPTRGTGQAVKGTDHYVMQGMDAAKTGKMIKAKKGIWSGAATSMYDKPPGWDVKKISDTTGKKLTELFKHRERGGFKKAKKYQQHLKALKSMTTKAKVTLPALKSKSYYFKDVPKASKLSRVLTKVGKRTGLGKAVAAATVVAGAYEAGKRKLFTKDKKKVDKKSIGGETVVMKSGGGYIDNLL